jgi:hypothetical protein
MAAFSSRADEGTPLGPLKDGYERGIRSSGKLIGKQNRAYAQQLEGGMGRARTTAPAVRGMSDLAFSATDPGSGVYEAVFSVDGQLAQRKSSKSILRPKMAV